MNGFLQHNEGMSLNGMTSSDGVSVRCNIGASYNSSDSSEAAVVAIRKQTPQATIYLQHIVEQNAAASSVFSPAKLFVVIFFWWQHTILENHGNNDKWQWKEQ